MNWKFIIILSIILLINILILLLIKIKIKDEDFDNINLDIGNELCYYFTTLGLSILQKKDFNYILGNLGYNMKEYFFFETLPSFIKYEYDNIYNCFVSNNITYEYIESLHIPGTWGINDNRLYFFWSCMKPVVQKILNETFEICGLKKEVYNPIIHFRCADTPFNKFNGYNFQYYSFFKEALEKISMKTNNKYNFIDIISCSFHKSDEKIQNSCKIYSKSLQNYLKEIGYESNIICNSNIDDFSMLFYAPAVISTSSSFSFMSGFFGNGIFISTEFIKDEKCSSCKDFTLYGYNLMHDLVDDYNNNDNVISLLKDN